MIFKRICLGIATFGERPKGFETFANIYTFAKLCNLENAQRALKPSNIGTPALIMLIWRTPKGLWNILSTLVLWRCNQFGERPKGFETKFLFALLALHSLFGERPKGFETLQYWVDGKRYQIWRTPKGLWNKYCRLILACFDYYLENAQRALKPLALIDKKERVFHLENAQRALKHPETQALEIDWDIWRTPKGLWNSTRIFPSIQPTTFGERPKGFETRSSVCVIVCYRFGERPKGFETEKYTMELFGLLEFGERPKGFETVVVCFAGVLV